MFASKIEKSKDGGKDKTMPIRPHVLFDGDDGTTDIENYKKIFGNEQMVDVHELHGVETQLDHPGMRRRLPNLRREKSRRSAKKRGRSGFSRRSSWMRRSR